jgi:hypothetical protein
MPHKKSSSSNFYGAKTLKEIFSKERRFQGMPLQGKFFPRIFFPKNIKHILIQNHMSKNVYYKLLINIYTLTGNPTPGRALRALIQKI